MKPKLPLACLALFAAVQVAQAADTFSWRYYRPTNTGIQGDSCEAIHIDPDTNPWISGYHEGFEEGGIAKFIVGENRWINVSNVDYPEIGHPDFTAISRVSDIDSDASGGLWMSTGRGGLYYNPAIGPSSLRRFGADNSPIHGGWNKGVEVAPDGSVWFSSYSTVWGGGGIAKYTPSTNQWQTFEGYGGGPLAIQPKPGGGYYVWTMLDIESARFDSTTGTWTVLPKANGNPAFLPGKNLTDSAGNTWMYRWTDATMSEMVIDLRRPNGTWVGVPTAPFDSTFNSASCLRAFDPDRAFVVDGGGQVYRYNGVSWTSLGYWQQSINSNDVDADVNGNVWVCGSGGAARRDATTGIWQRYRITNTSQYDFFNNDLTLDANGGLYACANAASGYGGMVKFDGLRWTGVNNHHYGLGIDWPFPTDNTSRVYIRPSNGELVLNPMFNGLHNFDGSTWTDLVVGNDAVNDIIEDSLGRLWTTYYGKLLLRTGSTWTQVSDIGAGKLRRDPTRPGTIWAMGDTTIMRTDGVTFFSRDVSDFSELSPQSDQFKGFAIGTDGIVWIGANTINLPDNSAVIKLNPTTGTYTSYRKSLGWPFPGAYAMPLAATPDGKIWMQYDSDFLVGLRGLFWFDGTNIGSFPAPSGGEAQWGGLPHAAIFDLEVRAIASGYELWMSCGSRGLAVLKVINSTHAVTGWVKQNGAAVPGATVKLMQGANLLSTATPDGAGNYRFDTAPGSYTLVPAHPDKLFFPATRSITVSGPVGAQNFTAANIGPSSITWQYQPVVYSDQSRMGTLGLNAITPVDRDITMSDNSFRLTSPIKVTVPAGQRTANFFVYGVTVTADVLCTVTATHQGLTATANITVRPKPVLNAMTLALTTVKGGRGVTGEVSIDKPAIGSMALTLTSSNPAVSTISPSPTAFANGTSTKSFYCRTFPVASNQVVTFTATFSGSTKTVNLTVTP